MNITDIFNNRSPKKLNEAIETVFGKKLNLEAFTIEQLEDSRNRLRTQLYTVRNSSGFNETVENDSYTKAQWMLDAINAEVMQRESLAEEAQSFYVMLSGPRSGQSDPYQGPFNSPDEAQAWINTETPNPEDYEVGEYPAGQFGQYENGEEVDGGFDPLKHINNPNQGVRDAAPDVDRGDYGARAALMKAGGVKDDRGPRGVTQGESIEQNINNGEDMTQVRESATDKASAVVTAKTMVDRVGRWIEELAGMENDTLLSLGDTIRDEMGQDQAKAFLSNVAPAIQQALQNLKATRETLATGVRGLTGEEQSAELIGSEAPASPELGGGPEDEIAPVAPDEMNTGEEGAPEDEFAASEPATGGMETAGRAQRESIDRSSQLLRVLAG